MLPDLMEPVCSTDVTNEVNNLTDNNSQNAGDSVADGSCVVVVSKPDTNLDEPYVGQEFDSEAAALEFYSIYAMRLGFVTRIRNHQYSQRDGSVVGKTLVCSREGFRRPSKRNETPYKKSKRPRPPTRVGCKALVSFKKQQSGKWVIRTLIKEHTHPLADGLSQRAQVYQIPVDDGRISELHRELMMETERSASLREFINLLFSHIEEHMQGLSDKIQYIVDEVKKIESEAENHQISKILY